MSANWWILQPMGLCYFSTPRARSRLTFGFQGVQWIFSLNNGRLKGIVINASVGARCDSPLGMLYSRQTYVNKTIKWFVHIQNKNYRNCVTSLCDVYLSHTSFAEIVTM